MMAVYNRTSHIAHRLDYSLLTVANFLHIIVGER